MKRYIILMILLWSTRVLAQIGDQNYILTRDYKQSGAASVNNLSQVNTSVQYLDGLGRPSQTVAVGQSTTGLDIVVPIEYDALGRQAKNYLPFVSTTATGVFRAGATSLQSTFYQSTAPGLESTDSRGFSETVFDPSPFERPNSVRAAGTLSASATITYGNNAASEVKKYDYTPNSTITATIAQNGYYAAGTLYKTVTTDENQKLMTEYKDMDGRVILKNAGSDIPTYYVYDDYGQLRAVLQPQYQDANSVSYAFFYAYDQRGRVITKKVPSADPVNMVYDNFDRLVMTQDAVQLGANKWSFIKYDALGRVAYTGEFASTANRAAHQALFDASTAHHESTSGSGIGYTLSSTLPSVAETDVRTVNYYDNYSFPSARAYTNQLGVTTTTLVKGQQTGSRTRMLNAGAQWLVSTTYYDTEYRPVQLIRDLFDLGTITTERVSTKYKYDLAPVVDVEWTEHLNSPTATIATNRVIKTFTYDHADRLLSVKENISVGSVSKEVTTLAQRYNVLGHLQSKWFQSANGQEFRRKTNYTNNIRGWQTDAKTVYKQTAATELPFYTIKLSYVNGSNYTNGNISKMEWGGKDDAAFTAGLSYTYDGINRLKSAVKPSGASYTYNESETGINYFRNGNIQNLVRAGAAVDNLTYTYAGNRLSSISDASGNNTGVKNGSSSFTYDNNGNMINDGNRGAILTYNMLNLPNTVTIASKIFTYDYDAAGSKHKYAGDTVNVKYAGVFEYDANNVVKRISTSEGQALFRSGAINFNYYVKDHLGNARVVFNEAGAILQKTDYYPFGLEIDRNQPAVSQAARNNANRYNFLGRETQVSTGYIDLQARFYDPLVARFMAVDPLAEKMPSWSPYSYGFNSPMRFIDPLGMAPDDYYNRETGKYLGSDGAATTDSRLISADQYSQISQANGGTTSSQATAALQGSSQVVAIQDGQIQTTLQGVRDNSRGSGVEHSAYLTLNPETATISAVAGPTGTNGVTHMEYSRDGGTSFMIDGEKNQITGTSILIGQVHGHPLTNDPNKENVSGTSTLDAKTSASAGVPIYSIDSYSGKKAGGVGTINRVTPSGVQSNGVGKTIGAGTIGNFNIGLDALQRSGGKIK